MPTEGSCESLHSRPCPSHFLPLGISRVNHVFARLTSGPWGCSHEEGTGREYERRKPPGKRGRWEEFFSFSFFFSERLSRSVEPRFGREQQAWVKGKSCRWDWGSFMVWGVRGAEIVDERKETLRSVVMSCETIRKIREEFPASQVERWKGPWVQSSASHSQGNSSRTFLQNGHPAFTWKPSGVGDILLCWQVYQTSWEHKCLSQTAWVQIQGPPVPGVAP